MILGNVVTMEEISLGFVLNVCIVVVGFNEELLLGRIVESESIGRVGKYVDDRLLGV